MNAAAASAAGSPKARRAKRCVTHTVATPRTTEAMRPMSQNAVGSFTYCRSTSCDEEKSPSTVPAPKNTPYSPDTTYMNSEGHRNQWGLRSPVPNPRACTRMDPSSGW
jgi:hypothetical protein